MRSLRQEQLAFTADLLGEAVISENEAEVYQQTCLDLLRGLAAPLATEPEIALIDNDDHGPLPRRPTSRLKLTSLTPRGLDALHAESTAARVAARLRPILRTAQELGAYVHVDMEQYAHKDLTHAIFRSVLAEPEFRDWPDVGIVVQTYQPEAEADLASLGEWACDRGAAVTIRLVKGAYWDYEVLMARQLGWPVPVYQRKPESDASYERCSRFLLANREWLRPAFGSHNIRSLAHAMAVAEALDVPLEGYEIQVLHGMGGPIQRAASGRGNRVRVYTPYGAMLPGMAYLVRRLLENTSNESFLKASGGKNVKVDDLLRDPEETSAMWNKNARPIATPEPTADLPPFHNEPVTDFTRPEARASMRDALRAVRDQMGKTYKLTLGREPVDASETFRID